MSEPTAEPVADGERLACLQMWAVQYARDTASTFNFKNGYAAIDLLVEIYALHLKDAACEPCLDVIRRVSFVALYVAGDKTGWAAVLSFARLLQAAFREASPDA